MKFLESPVAAPGQCGKCGSAQRDFYIDTELSFDFFGAFYFCNICAAELAGLAGFATPDYVRTLNDTISKLESEKYSLQRQVDGLEKVVEGFTLVNSGSNSVPGTDSQFIPNFEVVTEESRTGETDMAEGEGESTESLHDERMAELSDDELSSTGESFRLNI